MCIHFVSDGLVSSLCMEQIFSRITEKLNRLIAKMAFSNKVLDKRICTRVPMFSPHT